MNAPASSKPSSMPLFVGVLLFVLEVAMTRSIEFADSKGYYIGLAMPGPGTAEWVRSAIATWNGYMETLFMFMGATVVLVVYGILADAILSLALRCKRHVGLVWLSTGVLAIFPEILDLLMTDLTGSGVVGLAANGFVFFVLSLPVMREMRVESKA
jgi:hypothetical protein